MRSRFIACFLFLFIACPLFPSPAAEQAKDSELVIGTKEAPPFAMKDSEGRWQGISIKLWEKIAAQLGRAYTFREYDLQGLLANTAGRKIDAAAAALTITAEREVQMDFSHPFHTGGLGIAVKKGGSEGWGRVIDRLFSLAFLRVVAALTLLLLGVGALVWFFERRHNPEQFGGGVMKGIGSAFWWSAVTMTTVGYGDKAPATFWGRLVALVWMFGAIVVISGFTAAMTSSLTLSHFQSKVQGPRDLYNVKVACVEGSTGSGYLEEEHISTRLCTSLPEALQALARGEVDAVVHDEPILLYYANTTFKGDISVLPVTFRKQQYGIALPAGSPLREQINREILDITSGPEWQEILKRYLGE